MITGATPDPPTSGDWTNRQPAAEHSAGGNSDIASLLPRSACGSSCVTPTRDPGRAYLPYMAFGFRRSLKLGPVRLTASKRGLTASTGLGPVRVSSSSCGRRTTTVRIPGTGLFWRKTRR